MDIIGLIKEMLKVFLIICIAVFLDVSLTGTVDHAFSVLFGLFVFTETIDRRRAKRAQKREK